MEDIDDIGSESDKAVADEKVLIQVQGRPCFSVQIVGFVRDASRCWEVETTE